MLRSNHLVPALLLGILWLASAAPAFAAPQQPVPQLPPAPPPQPVAPLAQPPQPATPPTAPAAPPQQTDLSGCKNPRMKSLTFDRVPVKHEQGVEEMRMLLTGSTADPVQIDCDGMQLMADQMEIFDSHQVVATGNVVYTSEGNRIAAERLEFDTRTRTGTFFNASGTVSVADRVDKSLFGTQEPDAYFRGEEIQKLGPARYRIVHGAFTTCVQPTPRWEMVAGSVTLEVDDHALLTNSVLKVKGVPLMYMPIFYYPVQKDDRATGFLIPVYGTSTIRGQSISNAFFWAINRSQDATFMHDWYSKTGQGFGSEYRYELGRGNRGNAAFNLLNEHQATYTQSNGTTTSTSGGRNYSLRGGLTQALGAGLHARANVDYSSDITIRQRYEQDIYRATNRTRNIDANVTGNWREYVLSATFNKNDLFYGENSLTTTGGLPRISFSRGERPIGKSNIYFGTNTEFVTQVWRTESEGRVTADRGLSRMDVNPVLRIPFTKLQFLTVNSSVSWRGTYWTESLNPAGQQVPEGIGRRYFDLQARITGPVFNRIFNTPNSGYAEKFKHVIEPTLVVQRITSIDAFNRIVVNDSLDGIVGNVTRVTYGLNNRLYAKKTVSREIVGVTISQTYYTDARASQYDPNYQSSFNSRALPKNFSPVRVQARVSPTDRFQTDFSTEWNSTVHTFTTFTANGTFSAPRLQLSAGWSQRRLIPELPDFSNPALANHDINSTVTLRAPGNHVGGTYMFNYDLRNDYFRQQRVVLFYNAQCCGVAAEYQSYNLGGYSRFVVPQDHRFNLSFTLAGIGTFSNFFGALGGQQGR